MKILAELYKMELEQETMLAHLQAESGSQFTAPAISPLPDFKRRWVIAQTARMHKKHGLAIPKIMLGDEFACVLLRNPYGVKVK